MKNQTEFLLGASTAAHQVEGNNIHSDFWALEQMEDSGYREPSLDADDHYNRYEEDIALMAKAGLNAYRFSIEWARIEPEKGIYDENAVRHYGDVLKCCEKYGIEPVVTMHHFSSPAWLIREGGWENDKTPEYFAAYCGHVVESLGSRMNYVCTINEANMGIQISEVAKDIMRQMGITPQIGMRFELPENIRKQKEKEAAVFGLPSGTAVNTFLTPRTEKGDLLIMKAHELARDTMKRICPHIRVGATFSLFDIQKVQGGDDAADHQWENDFGHYLPCIEKDDFIGIQNYTRKIIGPEGALPVPDGAETTQMGYEFYPESLANVLRHVAQCTDIPLLVTENGIATDDDAKRIEFIRRVLDGIHKCRAEGIPVIGYLHWSLLDNFEWQEGYAKTFGLIAVHRNTQKRLPKPSLFYLGNMKNEFIK